MGCDIHPHLEVKLNGEWKYFSPLDMWRSYSTFAKMANVRNWEEGPIPISPPKGLPNDVAFMTKFFSDYDGVDGHSHSWLGLDEIIELLKFFDDEGLKKPWGSCTEDDSYKWADFGVWLFGKSISGLKKYPGDYPKELEDVRMVFWFDN